MRVAILYICTGKYSIFWNDFYSSCEKHFLSTAEKKYFVFSDTLILHDRNENVELITQPKLGWPYDTLMRFHFFSSIEKDLKEFDYIFFFNANTNFVKDIDDSILFKENSPVDLIVTQHPFFCGVTDPKDFPYERNPKSTAYIPKTKGSIYVLGGFNGGKTKSFLELIETLKRRIDVDQEKNIIAIWHDESHLNKYIFETKSIVKVLDYNYGFPKGYDLPLKNNVYIEFLIKTNFGGHDFLRGTTESIPTIKKTKSRFKF